MWKNFISPEIRENNIENYEERDKESQNKQLTIFQN